MLRRGLCKSHCTVFVVLLTALIIAEAVFVSDLVSVYEDQMSILLLNTF